MSIEPSEPLIGELMDALIAAAKRGVDTYLSVDAYNFLAGENLSLAGPLWARSALPKRLPEPYESRRHALELLDQAGGHYAITNMPGRPFTIIPAGRSHIKTAIVGSDVYVGGCNLHIPEELDVMVTWRDTKTADWLFDTMCRIVDQQSTKTALGGVDRGFEVDDTTTLLLDAGTPRQSLILDEAYKLIDTARESIFLTCQYFPGDSTAQHLRAAHSRGVRVTLIYSHPSAHGELKAPAHHAYGLKERLRLPQEFFAHRLPKDTPLLHAKVLVTDQGSMIGSHNYVVQGVNFGTAELALLSHDPQFGQALIDKITEILPPQP
jgi:phosphatidylserine/phosphatidylglycerophosphate/cardiolipin synthase-like enzyme